MNHWQKWQRWLDENLREVIGDGNVAHLPGAGQPLNLDDDPNTPAHLRAAHKIMKDHDVLPEWVMMAQELETERANILQQAQRQAQRHRQQARSAIERGDVAGTQRAENLWQQSREACRQQVEAYNSKVLNYNLKVPPAIPHKDLLVFEAVWPARL